MENIKDNVDKYVCNICNKLYSSYKSLWNHNKDFHKNNISNVSKNIPNVSNDIPNVSKNISNVSNDIPNVSNNILNNLNKTTCKYCNKNYSSPQNRWKHEQKCKTKEENNKIQQLEETINEMKEQFALILKEKGKVHHKTLKKINNQVTNNINSTSNGNINNGNIINNTFVKFGDVDYQKILDNKQVKHILNHQFMS